jgi:ATP-binding cassette subfamily G (WHITE) protein 2
VEINAEALTMWVSAFTRSEKMASALAPIPLVLSILFGGFFISASAIPVFLRWIRYLAFMRWSYVALVRNEMNGRVFDCPAVAASQRTFNAAVTGGACIADGDAAVELLTPTAQLGLTACAWVLVGMACTCWFGTYWVLRYNKPRYDTSV